MDFNEIRELLAVINQTDITEFTLKSGDFELVLRKNPSRDELPPAPKPPVTSPPTLTIAAPAPSPLATKLLEISSPMVGTFYRAPAPDETPFVEKGDRIQMGQAVCIIEAMKVMNEIDAEVTGEIVEILLVNGDPVEYGQVLMRVNPG